ncbi:hypothetical protein ACP3VU_09070 [Vibrio sp. PNB23_22_6]|uniref:hypothetical protein n=2 Tax=Vibrionaceae TaxID=641 RepID=UPI0034605185
MLVQMVSARLGVSALPNWAISEFARQGLITSMPLGKGYGVVCLQRHETQRKINAIYRRSSQQRVSNAKATLTASRWLNIQGNETKLTFVRFELIGQWVILVAEHIKFTHY